MGQFDIQVKVQGKMMKLTQKLIMIIIVTVKKSLSKKVITTTFAALFLVGQY